MLDALMRRSKVQTPDGAASDDIDVEGKDARASDAGARLGIG